MQRPRSRSRVVRNLFWAGWAPVLATSLVWLMSYWISVQVPFGAKRDTMVRVAGGFLEFSRGWRVSPPFRVGLGWQGITATPQGYLIVDELTAVPLWSFALFAAVPFAYLRTCTRMAHGSWRRLRRLEKRQALLGSAFSVLLMYYPVVTSLFYSRQFVTAAWQLRAGYLLDAACVLCGMCFLYMWGRAVYVLLRWRWAREAGFYCDRCGYNLTGNISGRCPECGALVPGLSTAGEPRRSDDSDR
jgi:hypothetical protein